MSWSKRRGVAKQVYAEMAAMLSARRRQIAADLEAAVASELPALKLERAQFTVAIQTDAEQPTDVGNRSNRVYRSD